MAESTLAINYDGLRNRVAQYLWGQRAPSLPADDSNLLDDLIQSGYRRFLWPESIPGQKFSHEWSFLKPELSVTLAASTGDYDLDDDFGGIAGPLSYIAADDKPAVQVTLTNDLRILSLRSQDADLTGFPLLAAVRPKTTDGTTGQRFEILVFPTPDAAYTLKGRMKVIPGKLTSAKYPYGGAQHAETLLAACMAEAEKYLHNNQGVLYAEFINRMTFSIQKDVRMFAAAHLGPNLDRSSQFPAHWLRDGRYIESFTPLTYRSIEWGGA